MFPRKRTALLDSLEREQTCCAMERARAHEQEQHSDRPVSIGGFEWRTRALGTPWPLTGASKRRHVPIFLVCVTTHGPMSFMLAFRGETGTEGRGCWTYRIQMRARLICGERERGRVIGGGCLDMVRCVLGRCAGVLLVLGVFLPFAQPTSGNGVMRRSWLMVECVVASSVDRQMGGFFSCRKVCIHPLPFHTPALHPLSLVGFHRYFGWVICGRRQRPRCTCAFHVQCTYVYMYIDGAMSRTTPLFLMWNHRDSRYTLQGDR